MSTKVEETGRRNIYQGASTRDATAARKASAIPRAFSSSKMQFLTSDLVSALGHIHFDPAKMGGKKHVDDVIRGLEDWNSKWFEELVAKVKGELNNADDDVRSIQSLTSHGVTAPRSSSGSASKSKYQPTVEDIHTPEDEYELGRSFLKNPSLPVLMTTPPETPEPPGPSPSPSSSSPSTSASPAAFSNSSRPSSPSSSYSYGNTPVHSRPNSPCTAASTKSAHTPEAPPPRPGVRFSDRPHLAPTVTHARGQPSEKLPADIRPVTLFSAKDEPTAELGRLLRSMAIFITAEWPSSHPSVLTPDQLLKFFSKFKLEGETLPFQRIFDSRSPKALRALEILYLDLRCPYHLIQPSPSSPARIPALTTAGFQTLMTLLILAAPDREARRLAILAQHVPNGPGTQNQDLDLARLRRPPARCMFPRRSCAKTSALLEAGYAAWCAVAGECRYDGHQPMSSIASTCGLSEKCPTGTGGSRRDGRSCESERDRNTEGRRWARGRDARDARDASRGHVRSREPSPPRVGERSLRRW